MPWGIPWDPTMARAHAYMKGWPKGKGKGYGNVTNGPKPKGGSRDKKIAWNCGICGTDPENANAKQFRFCHAPKAEANQFQKLEEQIKALQKDNKNLQKQVGEKTKATSNTDTKEVAWTCTCGVTHHNNNLQKCRTCGKARNAPTVPTVVIPSSSLSPSASSPSYAAAATSPPPQSPPSDVQVTPPVSIPTLTHTAYKVLPLAQTTHLTKALATVGVQLQGVEVEVEPPTAVAAQKVQQLDATYRGLLEQYGAEDDLVKAALKSLEAAKTKAGTHAQLRNGKQVQDVLVKLSDYALKAEAEHRTIRAQAVQNLAIIQKVMDEQNAYIKALDTSFALRERQTEDTRQQLLTQKAKIEALSEAKDADAPMTVAPPAVITTGLTHDTIDAIRTTLQSFLDGLLSDTPTAPSDTVARLTEVISTLLSTAPASSFGPAPAPGTLTAAREASQPYAVELNQDEKDV